MSWHCEIRDKEQAIISPNVRLDAPSVDSSMAIVPRKMTLSREGPRSNAPLRQIDGEAFEIAERAISQRRLVGGPQDHTRRVSGFEGLLPALGAQAPAIAGFETGKTDFRYRRRQVVAARFGETEKGIGHHHANRMAANILTAGIAAAVPVKARHWLDRTRLKGFAEDIARWKPRTPFIFPVVSQH